MIRTTSGSMGLTNDFSVGRCLSFPAPAHAEGETPFGRGNLFGRRRLFSALGGRSDQLLAVRFGWRTQQRTICALDAAARERQRIAYHEASHAVIGRYFGMPVYSASVEPNHKHFAGIVRATDKDIDPITPQSMFDHANDICARVQPSMPGPGEPRGDASAWLAHCQCLIIELVAGKAGEILAGFLDGAGSDTDDRLAKIYSESITVRPEAAKAFVGYCRIEATALLEAHWDCVVGIAKGLQAFGTLSGEQATRS